MTTRRLRDAGRSPIIWASALCLLLLATAPRILIPARAEDGAERIRSSPPPPPGFKLEGDPRRGRIIYKQYCQKCHGKKGDGNGMMAKDLDPKPRNFTDKELMSKLTDWDIYIGIKEGGASVGLSEKMTPWEDTLLEQEMMDVALYIRQFAADP